MNNSAILEIVGIVSLAVLVLAAIVIFLIFFIKSTPEKRREIVNELLFALAVEAERLYGSKTGQIKKKQVIAWFYERYKWLARLIPQDVLSEWIDDVVSDFNVWMKSNPAGASNIITAGETE